MTTARRSPGRRPGGPDTRGEILAAARESFASKGFDGTSLRGIARAAGVDAALVHHYFDGKEGLFVEALELPVDPRIVAEAVWNGPVDQVGERIAGIFLSVWDTPESRVRLQALLRSATGNPDVAHLMRDALTKLIFQPVSSRIDAPDAELRVSLVASQLIGMAMVRYVLEAEPLARATTADVAAWIAPTLQRYLTG